MRVAGRPERQRQPLPGVLRQRQRQLAPQRRRHRRLVEDAALQQQRQPVDALGGFGVHGRGDQGVHQVVVAQQAVAPGAGQAQRLAEQVVALFGQEAQQHRVIRRHQPGVVHRAREPSRLVLQAGFVHRLQPAAVDLDAGVLPAGLGGAVQAGDQPVHPQPTVAQVDVRVAAGDRDLGDHRLDLVDLDGPLPQDPPDLVDQAVQHAVVADLVDQVPEQVPGHGGHPALQFAFGLGRRGEQQRQVDRQHLGQVVAGLLGGDQRVQVVAVGDRGQPQLANRLQHDGVLVLAAQRAGAQRGQQGLRGRPVGAQEQAGGLQLLGPRLHRGAAAGLQQHQPQPVQDAAQFGRFADVTGLRHDSGGVAERRQPLVQHRAFAVPVAAR
ncbi:hypothetical protein C1Y40_02100 [Mycobacterium talmoniae]|uniref:Uncharacterized protein n=1 Tax=Mycobacterium talmoniae TaxID=1858794 RepID=A0A2S8BM23_9MYCO|nr:hypothetical protein C1Y40_02100 [Mycobacterium talmoniae]